MYTGPRASAAQKKRARPPWGRDRATGMMFRLGELALGEHQPDRWRRSWGNRRHIEEAISRSEENGEVG